MFKYEESTKEKIEKEKMPETRVVLHFLRHEQQTRSKSYPDTKLTIKGRRRAIEKGKKESVQEDVAWAAGSERVRSAHTALLRMVAGKEGISDKMKFDEVKDVVEKELKYGKKVTQLPELDYYWEGTPEFEQAARKNFDNGRILDFLFKESDDLVRKLKDKESLSYSRMAANYASLITREMIVGNNFNKLAALKPEEYKKLNNQLERVFGTHQTVSECFYMKVLEKIYGAEKVKEFIKSLQDEEGKTEGFDYQEGFKVMINNGPEGQEVVLEGIRGFSDIKLTPELLDDIISDAGELDKEL